MEAASQDVKQLCVDLREDFPHAYVNSYLTPPASQAVAPHADDRDVLVWQAAGSKHWKVYGEPPIPYPFTLEQVGKYEECPVPEATLAAPPLLEVTLEAGDLLYMPRGFVHEATTSQQPSLHLTIALATHDWCWSKVVGRAMSQMGTAPAACAEFMAEVEALDPAEHRWRHSIPPCLFCDGGIATDTQRKEAEVLLDSMLKDPHLRGVTKKQLMEALSAQVSVHNQRQDAVMPPATQGRCLTQDTFVRRLTDMEKARVELEKAEATAAGVEEASAGGLVARDEIADALMKIVGSITTTPVTPSTFSDAPMLCSFSKVCFAEVCMRLGILVPCQQDGASLTLLSL